MNSKRLLAVIGLALLWAAPPAYPAGQPAESADRIRPLLIGAEVPPLSLKTGDGAEFDLNAAIARKPTILIFYRGGW